MGTKRPAKRVTQSPPLARSPRPTRAITRSTKPPKDEKVISTKDILSMSQTELLDCILTRLEELEYSQSRTSLQVRVLTRRLMREKYARKRSLDGLSDDNSPTFDFSVDDHSPVKFDTSIEENLDLMMSGDGEDEAWLLAGMRKGPAQIPSEMVA